jgi:hypothetical protein
MLDSFSAVDPVLVAAQPSRGRSVVALVTCDSVVLLGSLSNTIFVTTKNQHNKPFGRPLPISCEHLLSRALPMDMPHEQKLATMQQAATAAGIPGFGEVLTAVFEHLQVFVMPMLHMDVESFIAASEHPDSVLGSDTFFEGSTYTHPLQRSKYPALVHFNSFLRLPSSHYLLDNLGIRHRLQELSGALRTWLNPLTFLMLEAGNWQLPSRV